MSFRYPKGGFITAFYDPLQVPNAPTSVSASAGDTQATVSFTAPTNVGGSAITGYGVISNPTGVVATGSTSPITITGLSNGTSYTFRVWALNSYGPSPYSAASGSVTPEVPQRAFFIGGYTTAQINVIQYVTITSTGNASDWGDLTSTRNGGGALSSSTRGVYFAGSYWDNVIQYFTLSSTGNASDFGDLVQNMNETPGGSNETRGLITGGTLEAGPSDKTNIIQYITIASTGNATDFGDLTQARGGASTVTSSTRSVTGGGNIPGNYVTTIDYVTIATTGNASSFGSLLAIDYDMARGNISSGTRGIFAGGQGPTNVIQYITIASTGNATDFGDLTVAVTDSPAGASSTIRGLIAGGVSSGQRINVIGYITIASTGNATDFGDILANTNYLAGCSNCHGGL